MNDPIISAGGLHALAYCERLFYLENVECIRVADERVYAGRRAHEEELPREDGTWARLRYESATLRLRGEVDLLRRVDGELVPYELKRGRAAGRKGQREAWETDRLQLGAYALLVEEQFGQQVPEGRVRYLADRMTIRVAIDEPLRAQVRRSLARARALSNTVQRPPVTTQEGRCVRCSLASVCLPEEARLSADPKWRTIRLLPVHPTGTPVHVLESGARVGRSDDALQVTRRDGEKLSFPIGEVGSVMLHGYAQISAQAIRLCAEREIPVHWVGHSGAIIGSLAAGVSGTQRHMRQFEALRCGETCLRLARALVRCKVEAQLRFILRATRGTRGPEATGAAKSIRALLRRVNGAISADELRGLEGAAARFYFAALPELMAVHVCAELLPSTRSRQPAQDRFSALLNYGYGMLYRQVLASVHAVGLHPGLGFFHRPRSSAQTLALDLMEIFRVPLVDMPIIGAVNRRTFSVEEDFEVRGRGVGLRLSGRRKLIELMERRLTEQWKHTVVGYSLSYARIIELEVRLLEKEWMDEGGLFAKLRIR